MSTVSVNIAGLDELRNRLKTLPPNMTRRIESELKDGAQLIAQEAKQRAPGNTGVLRQSIGSEKSGDLAYEVFSGAEYSAFVEFGTGTHVEVPPGLEEYAAQFQGGGASALSAKEAIFEWCRLKGIDPKAWYAIYITIMRAGIHPQPFFFPAKEAQEPKIINNINKALVQSL